MKKILKFTSFFLRPSVSLFALGNWLIQGRPKGLLIAGLILVILSGFLSRFLARRSRGMEASFFTVRIVETDSEATRDSTDVAALVGAGALILFAIFLPLFRH